MTGFFLSIVGCGSPSPHEDVLRSDPNYPKLNPNPIHRVLISGTLPDTLPVRLAAYCTVLHPQDGENDYPECYRPGIPAINLHLTEPLQLVRQGPRYETWVTVDKYLPGRCGWVLNHVGYQVLNTLEYKLRANNPGWPAGSPVVAFTDPSARRGLEPGGYWRGPVDVWCHSDIEDAAQDKHFTEVCGLSVEVTSGAGSGIADSERGTQHTTWVLPDTRTVTLNFHDLDAKIVSGDGRG